MRRKRPLARNTGVVRDATLVVIASEDRYAVKQYFEFFRSSRLQFLVLETADSKSSPEQVMARLEKYLAEYDVGEGDAFWFVCDTDHWANAGHIQNLVEVLRRCRAKGIGVAISNPCFEYWLLLHFRDHSSGQLPSCDEAAKLLRAAAGAYDKSKVYRLSITQENVLQAVDRAKRTWSDNKAIPEANQTGVFLIIDALLSHGIIVVEQSPPEAG